MGLAEDINCVGYHVREVRVVGDRGQRLAGFGTRVFDSLTDGRFVTLARSPLSRLLFERAAKNAECLFDDEITDLCEHADGVHVQSKRAGGRRFDLVVGADGLHSQVGGFAFWTASAI
jgi:2-polyprenyl-6-methoxyphenol hydroxylase-like FAD-dependent oxidoreductase